MRRPSPPRDIPPPLELECLKALWLLGEANVKDVRERLTRNRNLAYTTVMTVLDRLVKRGRAARRKLGRSFLYAPLASREELRRLALKEFIDTFFDGSEDALRAFLRNEPAAELATSSTETAVEDGLDTALL